MFLFQSSVKKTLTSCCSWRILLLSFCSVVILYSAGMRSLPEISQQQLHAEGSHGSSFQARPKSHSNVGGTLFPSVIQASLQAVWKESSGVGQTKGGQQALHARTPMSGKVEQGRYEEMFLDKPRRGNSQFKSTRLGGQRQMVADISTGEGSDYLEESPQVKSEEGEELTKGRAPSQDKEFRSEHGQRDKLKQKRRGGDEQQTAELTSLSKLHMGDVAVAGRFSASRLLLSIPSPSNYSSLVSSSSTTSVLDAVHSGLASPGINSPDQTSQGIASVILSGRVALGERRLLDEAQKESTEGVSSFTCDRRSFRTDVCIMRGDVRYHSRLNVAIQYGDVKMGVKQSEQSVQSGQLAPRVELVRPYPFKWDKIMSTIQKVFLIQVGFPFTRNRRRLLDSSMPDKPTSIGKNVEGNKEKKGSRITKLKKKRKGSRIASPAQTRHKFQAMQAEMLPNNLSQWGFLEWERREIAKAVKAEEKNDNKLITLVHDKAGNVSSAAFERQAFGERERDFEQWVNSTIATAINAAPVPPNCVDVSSSCSLFSNPSRPSEISTLLPDSTLSNSTEDSHKFPIPSTADCGANGKGCLDLREDKGSISVQGPDELPFAGLLKCDVNHTAPGMVFSTGGYVRNTYHEWHNGILPLWVSTQHLAGMVTFVIVQPHAYWLKKYRHVIHALSNYPVVLAGGPDNKNLVHCFPELVVGLKIHGELSVLPEMMPHGETILDFQVTVHKQSVSCTYRAC
eukprot:TRINITY_DN7532_c0_g6_i1.p1 TRINITY_DN7532_c0_g6~~TRINITY_DN7532_c0_g6_i1.p1  ORF type:complete len:738 (-),score=74.67 TRINITY_DN7532_c0_g6_i1:1184-3397(-)